MNEERFFALESGCSEDIVCDDRSTEPEEDL
jgi:hypothetical protein